MVPTSTVPSDNITLIFGLSFKTGKPVCSKASIVIAVVVAVTTRPPVLAPDLTGSFISMTEPGLTTIPESIEVENVTVSLSLSSAKRIARPNLWAWPCEVHANAFTVLIALPNLFRLATSSALSESPTSSKSTSLVSILK